MSHPLALFSLVLSLILSVTFHEAAHGYVAKLFGDPTAEQEGRLTLNPLVHMDPLGTVLFPLMSLLSGSSFFFGYAKPVPVRESQLHPQRIGRLAVSLAGIAMNLLLALGAAGLLHVNPGGETLGNDLLFDLIRVNVSLAAFNLFPLLPLDGGRALNALLPSPWSAIHARTEAYGMIIVIGLLLFPHLLPGIDPLQWILSPLRQAFLQGVSFLAFHG